MAFFRQKKGANSSPCSVEVQIRKHINQELEIICKKNSVELDLLIKIKHYAQKRSAIEQEYGQALQTLQRHFAVDDSQYEQQLGFPQKSVYGIWNAYLDEVRRLGVKHQSLGQFYAQNVANNARNVHTAKINSIKKVASHYIIPSFLKNHHMDFIIVQRRFEKICPRISRQFHLLGEAQANLFGLAKGEIERGKIAKKKKLSSFNTTELEKAIRNSYNLYLIRLQSAKTHRDWFTKIALPKLAQETEGDVYEKVWTSLSAATCIEIEHGRSVCAQFGDVSGQMETLPNSDEYFKLFSAKCEELRSASSGSMLVEEPPPSASASSSSSSSQQELLVHGYSNGGDDPVLADEAKVWISSKIRAQMAIQDASQKLEQLHRITQVTEGTSRSGGGEVLLREEIRKAEVSKMKAEAILEMLKAAGVDIDKLSTSGNGNMADGVSMGASIRDLTKDLAWSTIDITAQLANGHHINNSNWTISSSSAAAAAANDADHNVHLQPVITTGTVFHFEPSNSSFHQQQQSNRKASLQSSRNHLQVSEASTDQEQPLFYCRAKYSYWAKEPEELTFKAGDILAVIDQAPYQVQDGWWSGMVVGGAGTIIGTFRSMLVEKMRKVEEGIGGGSSSLSASTAVINLAASGSGSSSAAATTNDHQRRPELNKDARRNTWYGDEIMVIPAEQESS